MTQRQSQVNPSTTLKVNLINIQQFAQLCRTTPRALRFYEQKGVFKPAKISSANGYRFYDPRQTRDFQNIKLLQSFQMSLKEISESLKKRKPQTILTQKLGQIKEELEQKQKEYKFLKEMSGCLTKEDYLNSKLKTEYLGPLVLFCTKVKHGEYNKINPYLKELYKVAERFGVKYTDQEITFYIDYDYRPKDATLELALICKGNNISEIKDLPKEYYFKRFPKTKVAVYDYKGPYEYLQVFYQKFYEIVENDPKINNNRVFEMYIKGPLSQKSSYDYLTKIGFPI